MRKEGVVSSTIFNPWHIATLVLFFIFFHGFVSAYINAPNICQFIHKEDS